MTRWRQHAHAELLALVFLLLGATFLRLLYLNAGLWLDEILTLTRYARLPYQEIILLFDSENQNFLYSLLAHTGLVLFGESAWALRLPAVVFGVAGIAALYFFAREVTTRREALLAAALLTFSYHHVWFSQNARGYSALLFWTLFSSWFFVRALKYDRPEYWIAFAITAAPGVYTHITMLALVLAQFIICLAVLILRRRKKQPPRLAHPSCSRQTISCIQDSFSF